MVVLYNPPSSANRKPVLPFSLLALGALLEGKTPYQIVDGNLEPDPLDALDRAIQEREALYLGVTVMPGPQLAAADSHCQEIRRRHPRTRIVWGGYFPTQHYDVCLRDGPVDFVVRGHGERAFADLVARAPNQGDPESIPGLVYRQAAAATTIPTPLPPLPDPEFLPDFPYHRIDMRRYVRNTFMGRTLSHHSSYGCPFFCNFCAVVNMVNGRWKAQSAERTARITRQLAEDYQLDAIEFFDNNFFVDQSRVAEFCERIMDLRIRWWGEARIDTLLAFSDSTWEKMARSGLTMVFLGAESGSDETLRRMQKGGRASVDKTLSIAQKMASYDIIPEFSFVLGNPPHPEKDTEETLRFIRRVKKVNPASEIVLYLYTPVPLAGELYDSARRAGFSMPDGLAAWTSREGQELALRRSGNLPWVSGRLHRRLRNFERVLNAYYPTQTDTRLQGVWRLVLKTISSWRYHSRLYHFPIELRALQRWVGYQRPETSGF